MEFLGLALFCDNVLTGETTHSTEFLQDGAFIGSFSQSPFRVGETHFSLFCVRKSISYKKS